MQSDSSEATNTSKTPPEAAQKAPRLAVCVATYMRPEGLERLLYALAATSFSRSSPDIEVVVVDNDPNGSAQEICDRIREWFPFELHYAIEKRRGIPQVRNTALSIAMPFADFVAFTDDDVEPTPGWLPELVRVQSVYGADVVAGPNPPRYLDEPPKWIVEGRFFESRQRATGTLIDTAATHNVLIRCDALEQMNQLFDERLALQGGEDTELFRRMFKQDFRMVWAADAIVHECVPKSRTTLRWVLRRMYRIANSQGSSEARRLEGLTFSWVFVNGLKCLARGGVSLLVAVALRQGAVARVRALSKLASGAGWLMGLFGLRYREYARVHGK